MIETMIETKHIIAELSVTEKICLYNALYEDLAGKGIEGDTELAHVNKEEMVVLRDMGGSGTINPNTGLIQFGGGSPPPPPAAPTNTTQTSEFPTELRPFIKDVLGKAQAIQEQRETEGYVPFQGPQVASFTPEQEQAFTGIQGLVGQGQEYFDPSTELAKSSAVAPTSEAVQAAMSPYTQNVVDIQQREALRQADVAQQQLGAQAVSAGGYGGSRMAILEAEQNRNTQQLLGDIQARGQAAAYEDAQTRLAQQRGRELAASGQLMNLGSVAPQQALKELTSIEAIGAQKQAQGQRALDITKQQFQEEQLFPEQTLQQYQSVIRGFPLAPTTYTNTQTTIPAPSYLQQAAGLGGLGLGVASAFGGFKAKGGLVSRMSGGQVDQNSGLGSIVVKRQAGSLVDLSVEELEKIANNLRVPGSQRAEASKLLQEKKSSVAPSPIKKPLSKLSVPAISPDDVDSSDNSSSPPLITPSPAIGTSNSSKPKAVKPTFGSLASLRETPKSDEYFAKATEILGKREKRILDKMDDPSDKYEYLAGLLSGIAGGTPGAGLGQLASEVAPQALAGAKELRKDREALQEKAEDTSLQVGKLGAEQEEKKKKLEQAIFTALTKSKLTAKDLASIAKDKVTAINIIQGINNEEALLGIATNLDLDRDVRTAAQVRLREAKGSSRINSAKPDSASSVAERISKLNITGS
jgi:hypothetical protein